ncbi:hypothetical protein BDF20DRAFT_838459 [Mycotypha africana]|uniref:uncharacterized protein n=1 Tax=Mycotypha africana TaxID=64632 RepID=UPI0022FFDA2F|nr:uncharacterized protein BDF20DRAFT_838459 [Mycotypha africana]KAI8970062.1 hypothetical protein BDF20DRAFT_838459 [Mycotypha africana]
MSTFKIKFRMMIPYATCKDQEPPTDTNSFEDMTGLTINTTFFTSRTVKPLTFCFYVSGHGWGHATRANQIIIDLLKLPAKHKVYVISTASSFIFQGVIELGALYRRAHIDAGVVQPLPYIVDREQTIADLRAFLNRRTEIIENELRWLKQVKADCVICDAPFVPCVAAHQAGIPAVISSNFTFDEIYYGLRKGDALDKEIESMVEQVISDYRFADLLVRLPGAIRIPSFDDAVNLVPRTPHSKQFPHKKGVVNGKTSLPCSSISNITKPIQPSSESQQDRGFLRRIIDVPLVFREYRQSRETVLDQVGIPRDIYSTHKILLLSFGGQLLSDDSSSHIFKNCLPKGWICIVCAAPDGITLPPNFYRAAKDAYVPDLTNACDVILGKLGYGTCSEAIGHSKPFVYVPRPQFIEERGLLKLMSDQGSAVELTREDFEQGNWAHAIISASQLSGTCQNPELRVTHNGGEIAAKNIESFVSEWNEYYANHNSSSSNHHHHHHHLLSPTSTIYNVTSRAASTAASTAATTVTVTAATVATTTAAPPAAVASTPLSLY